MAIPCPVIEPICCICERQDGEDGAELTIINTDSCVVPICNYPCMYLARVFSYLKCRICGSVGTIRKENIPGGLALGQHTFIIFTEGCKFCGKSQ